MLILTRRPGERLCIGENVVVTILAVKGNQVRVGITAPRNVAVDREEIHQRKLADQRVTVDPQHPVASQDAISTREASSARG